MAECQGFNLFIVYYGRRGDVKDGAKFWKIGREDARGVVMVFV